jgi:hypothetical protein
MRHRMGWVGVQSMIGLLVLFPKWARKSARPSISGTRQTDARL